MICDQFGIKATLKKLIKFIAKDCPTYQMRAHLLRRCNYRIGKNVFIGRGIIIIDYQNDASPNLVIGDRVAISPRVTLVLDSIPHVSKLVSYGYSKEGYIIIENDAWIGTGSVVLPNIRIGECAIVGANSLVTKDVPPYTLVGGIPAKKISDVKIPIAISE